MNRLLLQIFMIAPFIINAQERFDLDSMFLQADSLKMIYIGFFDDNSFYEELNQMHCEETSFYHATNSSELIELTYNAFNFRESNELLFCGFDYRIEGFKDDSLLFTMEYNSGCNYVFAGGRPYWTDSSAHFTVLIEYVRFKEFNCKFRTAELMECFIESLYLDESIQLLEVERKGNTDLYHRLTIRR